MNDDVDMFKEAKDAIRELLNGYGTIQLSDKPPYIKYIPFTELLKDSDSDDNS
jgi:hypothetical protein